MTATCKVTVMQGANTLKKSVSQVMAETSAYMRATDTNPSVGSEWYVLGLARGGLSLKENISLLIIIIQQIILRKRKEF